MAQNTKLEGKKLFRKGEPFLIHRSTTFPYYDGVLHSHDFLEIVYAIKAEGIHQIGNEYYEIKPGDLFIINYDQAHNFFAKPDSTELPETYDLCFFPDFIDGSLIGVNSFADIMSSFLFRSLELDPQTPQPDIRLIGTEFTEFGELYAKMEAEYIARKKGYEDVIRACVVELIVKIFRKLDAEPFNKPSAKNIETINQAILYLKDNFNTDVTLEEVAKNSFLSKYYFSKLFHDATGKKFSEYVNELRIEQACNLLKTTDMNIVDVAFQSGFKDIKFFYSVFKKQTGLTPGAYKKR